MKLSAKSASSTNKGCCINGYGNEIYQEALQIVRERRLKAEAAYRETYSKLAEIRPEIADIDRKLAELGVKAAKAGGKRRKRIRYKEIL